METGSSEETRELQQPSSSKTSETDDILLKVVEYPLYTNVCTMYTMLYHC